MNRNEFINYVQTAYGVKGIAWLYGTTMTQGRLYAEDLNQFTGRGIPMIRELARDSLEPDVHKHTAL